MAEGPGGFGEDSLGIWLIYLVVNLSLVVKRFTRLRQNLMALLNGIRPVLLPSDMLKNMRLSKKTVSPVARITSVSNLLAITTDHQ